MAKSIVPFNYNEIYQGIAKKFLEYGYDIPYEGSNVSVLTSAMAYAIQALNFNTAMNINESLLPLNKKRVNAVQNARILSYEPKHLISNQLNIYLKPKKAGYLEIKKYQDFTINGKTYYYFGDDLVKSFADEDLSTAVIPLIVKEGTLLKWEDYESVLVYSLNESTQYIDIPFDDVEDDGLIVVVDRYSDTGDKEEGILYSKKAFNLQDGMDIVENAYYRKDDLETGNCRIYFKLGGLGKTLKQGSKIYVNVLRSNGASVNSNTFTASVSSPLSTYVEILNSGEYAITNYINGRDEEDIESIQTNAPLFFNTAGRCITAQDYKTFLASQNAIYEGLAWGGEEELVPQVGRIYYAGIPRLSEPEFSMQKVIESEVDLRSDEQIKQDAENAEKGEETVYESSMVETQRKWETTSDKNEVDAYRKLNYKNNLFIAEGDYVTAVNYISEFNPPSLLNYVKNPVYVFADINLSIVKYEYGANKSEVHQKIFDAIKAYFDERKGFGVNFVESTLSKEISNILGDSNGFLIDTLLSAYMSEDNKVMQVSKDFDYDSDIISYKTTYNVNTNQLEIVTYLNSKCAAGDSIKFVLNHTATNGLMDLNDITKYQEVDIQEKVLSTQDINQGEFSFILSELSSVDLNVVWRSQTTSASVVASEIPITFKNLYYATEIRGEAYHLSAVLPSSVKEGDTYIIYYVKGGILTAHSYEGKVLEQKVTYEQVLDGKIDVDLIFNHNDEIEMPDDLTIRIGSTTTTLDGTNELTFELDPVQCDTYEDAVAAQERDESTIYDEMAGKSAFFVSNVLQRKTNSYKVTMYLADYMMAGDKVEISYAGISTTYELTDDDIKLYKATSDLAIEQLDVTSVSYTSENDVTMTILKYGSYSNEQLLPLADDRIQYSSSEKQTNTINYTPTTAAGGQISLISGDNVNVTFYRTYSNSLDLRNLITNFGPISGDDAVNYDVDSGTHKRIASWVVTVVNGDGAAAYCNYNDESDDKWILHCDNPTRSTYVDVSISLQRSTADDIEEKTFFSHFRINIKDMDSVTTTLSEGAGGLHMYLDLPPEGIYGADGNINYDNLPRIFALGVQKSVGEDTTIYSIAAMNQSTESVLSRANTNLAKMIYVDFDTTNDSILEGMYPYFISRAIAESQADNTYKWIRFPIKYAWGSDPDENTLIIGTYIIVNDVNPYVRIKLKNEAIGLLGTDLEFEFVYPSRNFTTIKNTALRLRSVNIGKLGENYSVRQEMRDAGDIVTQDLFASWATTYEA